MDKITVGILLKRNPILNPKLNPYESSYYLLKYYENQESSRPFNQEFYYKKGSTSETRFIQAKDEYKRLVQPVEPDFENHVETVINEDDLKSLNRKLTSNLYYFGMKNNRLFLPEFPIVKDSLYESCKEALKKMGKMETFTVGKSPVGHTAVGKDQVVYYMKSIILAGKVIDENHAWLTKEEVELIDQEYFSEIGDLLS
jgi:large subunit ribosomal protein L46